MKRAGASEGIFVVMVAVRDKKWRRPLRTLSS
jgi:hypothetical protein